MCLPVEFGRKHLLNIGFHWIRAVTEHFFFIAEHDGRKIGDSGSDTQDRGISVFEDRHVLRKLRAWSHQTHVATQHIPELWQFVQFSPSQKFPEPCDSPIPRDGDEGTSTPTRMVRNFRIRKTRKCNPTRNCVNRIGLPLSRKTARRENCQHRHKQNQG